MRSKWPGVLTLNNRMAMDSACRAQPSADDTPAELVEIAEYEDESGHRVSGGVRTLDEMVNSSSRALREIALQLKEVIEKKHGSTSEETMASESTVKSEATSTSTKVDKEVPAVVSRRHDEVNDAYARFRERLDELERLEAHAEVEARKPGLGSNWKRGFFNKQKRPVTAAAVSEPAPPGESHVPAPLRAPTSRKSGPSNDSSDMTQVASSGIADEIRSVSAARQPQPPTTDSPVRLLPFSGCVGRVLERSSKPPTKSKPPVVDIEGTQPYRDLSRFKKMQIQDARARSGDFYEPDDIYEQ